MHQRPVNMENPNADRIKRVAQLAGRSAVRTRRKQFLVEGPQSATEALRAHLGLLNLSTHAARFWLTDRIIAEVYYTRRLVETHPAVKELIDQLSPEVFVAETSDRVLQAMSDAVVHQSIIVVAHVPDTHVDPGVEARLVAGLIRIQDPGNAGTIIRAADAAGADYILASQGTVDIYNPKTVRSTAGSLFHLPVYTQVDLRSFATRYHGQIVAADGYGQTVLDQAETSMLAQPTAWLFGNEARGLDQQELEAADVRIAVPLYGLAESLNVATAATICLYSSAMAQRRH